MEVYNSIRCITHEELVGVIGRVGTCNALVGRGQVNCVRRGCRNTPALYAVDSLPYKYRCEVYKRYPDLQAQAEAKPFVESVVPDGGAMLFFEGHTFADGSHLTSEKVTEYSNNAAVLNAFGAWIDRSNGMRAKTGHRSVPKGEFWEAAAKALPRIADKVPHSLPENPRRLQEKYNQYRREGYAALISGKHGNSNASKVATQEQKGVIIALCAVPNGWDNVFVARMYNQAAEKQGWEKITAGTVARIRKENALAAETLRHGTTAFSNTRAMQVTRSKPTAAMLMWSLDGWDAELYYQKRNGRGDVTYSNRKVLEVVLDPCCDFPIGYAIGDTETSALIQEALRNAENYTRELFGQRYRTCQIQSDHYAMTAMTPYYATVADKVTPARVRNAKSKPIERYFLHLNDTYCKTFPNWSGYGITARKDRQPSAEFKNVIKKDFPDEEGVVEQLKAIIEWERQSKMEEYLKFWEATPAERRLPLSDEAFLLRFGRTTGYTNVLEGSGLRPRIEGRKMAYDCFDIRFRELAYLRWEVRYDTSDLSHVLAMSEDGKQRFMLEEKYVQPMALAERTEGDAKQLQKIQDHNSALLQNSLTVLSQAMTHAAPLLGCRAAGELESQDSRNVLAKALITDSRGQHKSRRAAERRRIAENTEYEEVEEERRERKKVPVPVVVVETPPAGERRIDTFDLY